MPNRKYVMLLTALGARQKATKLCPSSKHVGAEDM